MRPVAYLGGKAAHFQATEAVQESLCTCPPCFFRDSFSPRLCCGRSAYGYVTKYEALQYVAYGILASNSSRMRQTRRLLVECSP